MCGILSVCWYTWVLSGEIVFYHCKLSLVFEGQFTAELRKKLASSAEPWFSDAFRTLEHTTKMYTLRIHSTYTRSCFVAMLDLEPGIFPARHDRSSSHFQLAWSMNKEFANIKTCNFIVTSRTNFSNIGNLDILR